MYLRVIVLFLCVFVFTVEGRRPASPLPVLIIPGLSASALYNTELNISHGRVWVNETSMTGDKIYKKNLAVFWDSDCEKVESYYNIDVYPGLEGVCNIAESVDPRFSGYQEFVDWIHRHSGSADAAPYDWRLMPQQPNLNIWAEETRAKILSLYIRNKNHSVVVVAHSMGNLMANFLFHTSPPHFFQYVDSFVSVSPPWGGAGFGLQAVVYGMEMGRLMNWNYTIQPSLLEHFPCFPWIFPNNLTYETTHIIKYNHKNYTSTNISLFFQHYDSQSPVLNITSFITSDYNQSYIFSQPPNNLPIYLIYSRYEPTAIGIQMVEGYWDTIKEVYSGEEYGDGTIPYKSLRATVGAWKWTDVIALEEKVKHGDIIKHREFFDAIGGIIGTMQEPGRA